MDTVVPTSGLPESDASLDSDRVQDLLSAAVIGGMNFSDANPQVRLAPRDAWKKR